MTRGEAHGGLFESVAETSLVHPVNECELLRDIPAHEENGDEVYSW